MPKELTSLKLATYNIHRCIGNDGEYNPDRTLEVIKQLDADIVALQEVETRTEGGLDLLDYFSGQTGMQAIPGLILFKAASRYGNAVLTRFQVKSLHQFDISFRSRERRGAISLVTQVEEKNVHLLATHLGLLPRERRVQVQSLLNVLDQEAADISILMGDLNEWFLWGRPLRWLYEHFSKTDAPATFPARFPALPLDRIWVQPRSYLQSVNPIKNSLTQTASDHLPLTAKLVF
jgi:endonuclease/exonuclease/phosphatase family metal-dependent hydrolase